MYPTPTHTQFLQYLYMSTIVWLWLEKDCVYGRKETEGKC